MARFLAALAAATVGVGLASCGGGESDATFPGPDGDIELDRAELGEALEVIISSELYTPGERVPVLKTHTSSGTAR